MNIKFIQINIYKGKYLDTLVEFLKKELPDFVSLQEVATGGFSLVSDKGINVFDYLKRELAMKGSFHGDLKLKGSYDSFFGNAVLGRAKVVETKVLSLKTFRPVTIVELDGDSGSARELIDRHLLDVTFELNTNNIHILSWHGAWVAPPRDTPETLRQSKLVSQYIADLKEPFILGCDSNNLMTSQTVKNIGKLSQNLLAGTNITSSLHPTNHKIAPTGYLVDFVFASKHFRLKKVEVPQVTISDHLPIVAELSLEF